jgi:acetyltransferase (GNAT) family protein
VEIVPFADEHLDTAAALLAERHARHREHEPLLPADVDFRAQVESEWSAEGASGVFSEQGYVFGRPDRFDWLVVGIGGHAVRGDAEHVRDLYAAAAARWVDEGHTQHAAFVPSHDAELVDAWFRLSFGASGVLAMRETGPDEPYDGNVAIRDGTVDDFGHAARLELTMHEAMQPSPSFSNIPLGTPDEVEAEWREDDDDETYELFVAERDGRIVGHLLLYRRPPDLRVPADSIDLAQGSTYPEARGTGVGRALTTHAVRWAYEHGHP